MACCRSVSAWQYTTAHIPSLDAQAAAVEAHALWPDSVGLCTNFVSAGQKLRPPVHANKAKEQLERSCTHAALPGRAAQPLQMRNETVASTDSPQHGLLMDSGLQHLVLDISHDAWHSASTVEKSHLAIDVKLPPSKPPAIVFNVPNAKHQGSQVNRPSHVDESAPGPRSPAATCRAAHAGGGNPPAHLAAPLPWPPSVEDRNAMTTFCLFENLAACEWWKSTSLRLRHRLQRLQSGVWQNMSEMAGI